MWRRWCGCANSTWRRLYASRSGVEGTVNEIVNGHQMRPCRHRGTAEAHVQHVLTAIAVNIERLSAYPPRPPTAFQQYLDARGLPRPAGGAKDGDLRKSRSPTESLNH
ncbi:transposase [Streptomyces sp. NPDC006356]